MELFTLDASGVPRSCGNDWKAWAESDFTVARTVVGPGYVSTIFLGWRDPHRRPDLFETMVFGIPELEGEEERYATREAALAGHARHVARARAAVGAEDATAHRGV